MCNDEGRDGGTFLEEWTRLFVLRSAVEPVTVATVSWVSFLSSGIGSAMDVGNCLTASGSPLTPPSIGILVTADTVVGTPSLPTSSFGVFYRFPVARRKGLLADIGGVQDEIASTAANVKIPENQIAPSFSLRNINTE
jgi:hypothetical protein